MLTAIAKVVGFIVACLVLGLAIQGVEWLIFNMWWLLVIVVVVLLFAWRVSQHPAVQAKRKVRAAVQRGAQQKVDIAVATAQAKVRMARAARSWKTRP